MDIKALPKNDAKYYFSRFLTTENRINLYSIFLERSSLLLNSNGNLSFINPNSLMINESYRKIRKFLVNDVNKIIKLPDSIFETASVETMIIIISKKTKREFVYGAYFNNDDKINFNNLCFNEFKRLDWVNDIDSRFNIFSNSKTLKLIAKLEHNSDRLEEYVSSSLGITPYDKYKGHTENLIKKREFHSEKKESEEYVPLISGKNIRKYVLTKDIKEYLKYGDWLGAPREKKFFTSPKIIVRQILGNKNLDLISAYSEDSIFFTQIGFSLISKNSDINELKYILGLLNSKLLSFYHKNKFLDIQKIVFQKILIANCKKLPIKKANVITRNKIILLVNSILNSKNHDFRLEQQIDNLVYKLYDLNFEEVKIIDPECNLKEEEYMSISIN